MRITILLTIFFISSRIGLPQTMNTILQSGEVDSCLIDNIQKITFTDTGAQAAMQIHLATGGTDTVLLDSLRKIFFDPDGVVPVVLSSFQAAYRGNGVALSWTTQSEKENLGWNVLRSSTYDGRYEKMNSALIPGTGTTGQPHSYSWQDESAAGTNYYYKLEQLDISGGKEYSWVVLAKSLAVTGIKHPVDPRLPAIGHITGVYPNPAASPVTIELLVEQPGRVAVGVYNSGGTQLLRVVESDILQPGRHTLVWDGRDGAGRSVGNGTYIIKANNGTTIGITKAAIVNSNGR